MPSCPCCGHPLPDNKLKGVELTVLKNRIFSIVSECSPAGIQGHDLMDRVYADRADGGPDDENVLRQHICQINKKISMVGLRIKGGYGYKLIELGDG